MEKKEIKKVAFPLLVIACVLMGVSAVALMWALKSHQSLEVLSVLTVVFCVLAFVSMGLLVYNTLAICIEDNKITITHK